jgi:molybdopterin/thiamine biosynthesis adenylyltransferase
MVAKEEVTISEAEAALYDRQIRLWGLEAQKRSVKRYTFERIDCI